MRASLDPSAEGRLVDLACACWASYEWNAPAPRRRPGPMPRPGRAVHDQRYLRSWTDAEGAWNLRVRDNPEVGAKVMGAIEGIRDRLFAEARRDGRRESSEAYAADALLELARGWHRRRHPSPGQDHRARRLPALLRGQVGVGEVCEVAGFGPVATSAIRQMLDTGDPFLAAIATKGEQVVGVAHLGRRANAHQQTALEWLYPTCAVEGCSSLAWLENDHRVDWARSHRTVLDLLDRLCSHHHDLKSRDGWGLVAGREKRQFVPPSDPRHPGPAERAA